jgi:hypothetical protein
MCRSVREHLKIIRRVLVMRGHKETHQFMKKFLTASVIREESVSVDVIELTLIRMRSTLSKHHVSFRAIQAEQVIEP